MESGYPHLLLNKCLIICWLQQTLWDATTTSPNYCTYLAKKLQWPSTTEPHQKLFHYAQQCLNQPEHKFISKFIHKWLPLHNWYHIWSASANNLFPSCHTGKETMEHFLTCPHIDHRSLWCNLHDQLYKLHLENKIDGPLSWHPLPLTIFGLPGHTTQPILLLTDLLAPIYQAQDQLGWKQLYYGQFVKEWAVKLTAVSPQTNCMMFYSWALTLILKTVLLQWKLQNEHLHLANHCKDDCMQLQNIIYQILHDMHNNPLLQDFLSSFELEVLLCQPTKYIHQWIQNCTNHIKAQHKASQLQAKLHTQDIYMFFTQNTNMTKPQTMEKNHCKPFHSLSCEFSLLCTMELVNNTINQGYFFVLFVPCSSCAWLVWRRNTKKILYSYNM